jgi:iron complex outermembrane receptor protein
MPVLRIAQSCSLAIAFFWFSTTLLCAQESHPDSIIQLSEVVVRAFEGARKLKEVPAAVNLINRQALDRFAPTSIVGAVNTLPGVRMEERSPGSYRLNIRGSSLRSPFGVRNVKVYYNDLPITDPGGQTYLNSLGFYNFNSLEIIKGPGSSLYGAGTGGAMLINSLSGTELPGVFGEYTTGSYGLQNAYGSFTTRSDNSVSKGGYQHQESSGYRDQSALRRDVLSWSGQFRFGNERLLRTTFLYSDLFYETPGALTKAETEANPKAARPAGGGFPGAEGARAAITQKTAIAGASYHQPIAKNLTSKTALYGAYTQLLNPAIRNYGRNSEPHVGGRTFIQWKHTRFGIDAGAEWQQGFAHFSVLKNRNGAPDTLQTLDEVGNRQSFVFAQAGFETGRWMFTAGASLNAMKVVFQRFAPAPGPEQVRHIRDKFTPRGAILYKLKNVSLYSSVSKGFSPPTTSELLPTGSAINLGLEPEEGINYDIGLRGNLFGRLYTDVNAFSFALKNTIVQRRDAGGGDYFDNAGATKQYGVETYLEYPLFKSVPSMEQSRLYASHTFQHFCYRNFRQGTSDFSGKRLPGVAPHTVTAGFDWQTKTRFLAMLTYYYSDKLPVNDGNTAFADSYHLLGAKIGYQYEWAKKLRLKIIVGADNLADQNYSLGNDLNGFGGRYYNPAPRRNYFITLQAAWFRKQTESN